MCIVCVLEIQVILGKILFRESKKVTRNAIVFVHFLVVAPQESNNMQREFAHISSQVSRRACVVRVCVCNKKLHTHTTTQSRKRNKQAFFICSVSDPLRRVQTTNERATSPARAREKVNSSRARPKQRICFFDLLNQFLVFVRH